MSEQSSVDFGLIVPRHPPIWDTDDIKLCQAESSWTMNPPRPHYTLSGTDRCVKHVLCPKICYQCLLSNKLKIKLKKQHCISKEHLFLSVCLLSCTRRHLVTGVAKFFWKLGWGGESYKCDLRQLIEMCIKLQKLLVKNFFSSKCG